MINSPSTEDIERHVRELEALIGVDEELQVQMIEIWLNTFDPKESDQC